MARINPAKQKLLDERNQRIYELYTNAEDPKSAGQIAKILEREGKPMTRQNVRYIIEKIKSDRQAYVDK
jgi:hypothetical protein